MYFCVMYAPKCGSDRSDIIASGKLQSQMITYCVPRNDKHNGFHKISTIFLKQYLFDNSEWDIRLLLQTLPQNVRLMGLNQNTLQDLAD